MDERSGRHEVRGRGGEGGGVAAGEAVAAVVVGAHDIGAEGVGETVQMIDSTVIRAHHCAAGARGGLRDRVSGAREVGFRPKFISAPTAPVSP